MLQIFLMFHISIHHFLSLSIPELTLNERGTENASDHFLMRFIADN